MWVPPCQVPEFFDEQIRKNRMEIYQRRQGEKLFFRLFLYIKTVIISSRPIHLWCIHLRKCIILRMRDEINWNEMDKMLDFFPTSWMMFSLIILTSSWIGYMCKTTWQKKTTPPPTTQWTFRIQSDATIKQIPRRPAVKSPINTINLWRCCCAFRQWKSFFSMSKDFWYTVYTYLYLHIFKDRYHIP